MTNMAKSQNPSSWHLIRHQTKIPFLNSNMAFTQTVHKVDGPDNHTIQQER